MVREILRSWIALAAFSLLAVSAGAQTKYLDVTMPPEVKVRVRTSFPWPTDCAFGYVPMKVELSNHGDRPHVITIDATDGPRRRATSTSKHQRIVNLEAGGKTELWMLTPNFSYLEDWAPFVRISVGTLGSGRTFQPTSMGSGAACVFALAVGRKMPLAGTNESLGGVMGKYLAAAGTGLLEARLGATSWNDLPDSWEAYSSLDVVAVDASSTEGMERHLEPILSWVRLGGKLVLVGEDDVQQLERFDGLKDAFESRRATSPGGDTYRFGLGRITIVKSAFDWKSGAWIEALSREGSVHVQGRRARLIPSPGNWQLDRPALRIPGIGALPLRAFLVGLLLFAVLIGPVNLLVLKRLQRPSLLLITIPGLSITATVFILLFGVLGQGLDVKQAEWSLSHLDQVSKRVADVSLRATYAGSSPGRGLLPKAGTAVFPERNLGNDDIYVLEQTGEGRVLRGSFLPVRELFSQVVMREAASRQRVGVSLDQGRIEVQNGLKSTISKLAYHAENGDWYAVGTLKPGASTEAKLDKDAVNELKAAVTGEFGRVMVVPPGAYLARLESNPFGDELGLEPTRLGNVHYVVGLLEQEEGR